VLHTFSKTNDNISFQFIVTMSSSSDEDDDKLREALAPGFTIDASKGPRHHQFINPLGLCLNYKIIFFQ
jgi:hypothetical protein